MPIILTFDLSRATGYHNVIRSALEMLGWERVGGSAWRYPRSDEQDEPEDWFNEVIPAILFIRQTVRSMPPTASMSRFSIDVHGSFSQFAPGLNAQLKPKNIVLGHLRTDLPDGNPVNGTVPDTDLVAWINGIGTP